MPVGPPLPRERLVDVVATYMWAAVSVIIIGHPGIGKSATAKAISRSFNWMLRRKGIPGVTDPIVLFGLPGQDAKNSRIKPYPWAQDLMNENEAGRRNTCLFDDIGESSRTVQTALLDVLGEREFAEVEMTHTSMVATANPIGGGLQVTPSMANRVGHVYWTLTPKEQAELMIGDYPNPDIPVFEENWEERLPAARRQVAGFLRTLNDFSAPDLDSAEVGLSVGAYPTARTWECAARLLAAIDSSDMDAERARQVRIKSVQCLVGDVAANTFFTFLAYPDMLKPEDVLRNPRLVLEKGELFEPNRPDRAFIFLQALTRYTVFDGGTDKWYATWEVLGHFANENAVPIASAFAFLLHKRRPADAQDNPPAMAHFSDILDQVGA